LAGEALVVVGMPAEDHVGVVVVEDVPESLTSIEAAPVEANSG
jgi:hypothetical protein